MIENIQEIRAYIEECENKGYKRILENLSSYIQLPSGRIYSESQLEKFAKSSSLKMGNIEHIEMSKAHNLLTAYELELEFAFQEEINNIFKHVDKATSTLQVSNNEEEILEARRLIAKFEYGFDEGIYSP